MLSREQITLLWSSEALGLNSWVTLLFLGLLLTIYAVRRSCPLSLITVRNYAIQY
jgi:hypothetical protein